MWISKTEIHDSQKGHRNHLYKFELIQPIFISITINLAIYIDMQWVNTRIKIYKDLKEMAYEYYLTNFTSLTIFWSDSFWCHPIICSSTWKTKSTKEKENMLRLLKTLWIFKKHKPKIKKETRNVKSTCPLLLKLLQEENKTLFNDITHYKRKIIFILWLYTNVHSQSSSPSITFWCL